MKEVYKGRVIKEGLSRKSYQGRVIKEGRKGHQGRKEGRLSRKEGREGVPFFNIFSGQRRAASGRGAI